MRGLSRTTLFHKKSRSNLSGSKSSVEEQAAALHARKWSTSSTASHTSSTASCHDRFYDPLSLHPPLSLNSSPHMIPEYDEEADDEDEDERERRLYRQARRGAHHIQDACEYSPAKGQHCHYARPSVSSTSSSTGSPKPYVYDQSVQWPLKDWQAIPPGLAELDSSPASSPARGRPANRRRRPTEPMNDLDAMLKRGDWKRRGIVFHLDTEDEQEQEQHFELPLMP
ncbi:hypothetical protein GGR54DRAFT_339157 [Hypoxylon sp. NC1633]|nr:hypothetical protein GGR54DRAFT_339157 [Hypoxylon sp. NC1633]